MIRVYVFYEGSEIIYVSLADTVDAFYPNTINADGTDRNFLVFQCDEDINELPGSVPLQSFLNSFHMYEVVNGQLQLKSGATPSIGGRKFTSEQWEAANDGCPLAYQRALQIQNFEVL